MVAPASAGNPLLVEGEVFVEHVCWAVVLWRRNRLAAAESRAASAAQHVRKGLEVKGCMQRKSQPECLGWGWDGGVAGN